MLVLKAASMLSRTMDVIIKHLKKNEIMSIETTGFFSLFLFYFFFLKNKPVWINGTYIVMFEVGAPGKSLGILKQL